MPEFWLQASRTSLYLLEFIDGRGLEREVERLLIKKKRRLFLERVRHLLQLKMN